MKRINVVIIILVLVLVGIGAYFLWQKQNAAVIPEQKSTDVLDDLINVNNEIVSEQQAADQAKQEAEAKAAQKKKQGQQILNALAFGGVGNIFENIKGLF